ncbi:MAG: ABC transporter ATP-binding protein [Bacilli bacterium]|nr:ABC transporter ATP-binding protein [Bacilli bacterium]
MAKKKKNSIAVKVEHLSKNYNNGKNIKKKVFDDFNIEFESGKIHCVLGVSGCGKSTLLRIIAGLEEYESGTIEFPEIEKKEDIFISMILQENNLLPWLTVYQNIEFALKSCKLETKEEVIDEILKKHNLYEFKKFYPYELSVGLKQKVALCKAINTKPKIILLDEPFCALDFISKENIHDIFLKEFSKEQFTSILSTHYLEEAVKLGDYIHLLGKDKKYIKVENPLKYPREKDKGYHEFLEHIKDLYS